jgi:hypothetical protein
MLDESASALVMAAAPSRRVALTLGLLMGGLAGAVADRASADDGAAMFQDRVAPVLERRCVQCHQGEEPEGGLSLVTAEAVLRGGDSGPPIVPGKPDESLLLDMVIGDEPAMPKKGPPLTEDEVAALRAWIAAGVPWPEGTTLTDKRFEGARWWSLEPIERPAVPPADSAWCRTPIDAFVLAKLTEQYLAPAPEADRRTLIRRLYFDLLGLPPAPEDVRAFVADPDPRAYDALVERLLASPHYGERWARHWLDVVKYADTCGYDKDKLRPSAWPYRDYVIRALNDDKPYARFVEEQIAGDVLFPGTADGILALGFLAAGPWDFIGHVEVPEAKIDGMVARHTDRDEMVGNTIGTFCSATIQCCQCHDHKFDPFTQQHYYNLQSVFAAVDRADRPYDLDPETERQRQQLAAALESARGQLAALEAAVAAEGGAELATANEQIAALAPRATPQDLRPEYGYHSELAPRSDVEKWAQVDLGRDLPVDRIVLRPCHDDFAGIGAGFGFPVRYKIEAVAGDTATVLADETAGDVPNPGLAAVEFALDGRVVRHLRVTATQLALRQDAYIFALAELQVFDAEGNNVALHAAVTSLDTIEAPVRWSRANLTDGIWATAADPDAVEQLAAAQRRRQEILDRVNTPERVAERERLAAEVAALEGQLAALPEGKQVYAAATHFAPQGSFIATEGNPRPIHVLHRGSVLQPRAEAVPGALPVIPGVPDTFDLSALQTEGDRRAALARWLTRADNPLVWRSIVNRVWQWHFGRGIVESPSDFGRMGALPTHPELLDWLAVEFRDGGGSFKQLHRLIVNSAAYRQSSAHNEAHARIDSDNRYLWRANRRRLEAEEIRDAMLSVSGRLNPAMGGPGYYLFVLEQTAHSPHYEYHKFDPNDPASHRRSIYRFVVRSQPDPYMTTLDCADSSQSTPQRNETLTSLQALSLLNNGFSLAMARHFADRLAASGGSVEEQAGTGFELVAGREPTDSERAELAAYAAEHGLANLCRVLLNLHEFVYVD